MSDINSITDKLAKLLRLSQDEAATDGEIANALNLAARLMAKHQLTRDDIDLNATDPIARVRLGRHFAFSKSSKITSWEGQLAMFVTQFISSVSCYVGRAEMVKYKGIAMLDSNGSPRTAVPVCFYGSDDDAESAVEMFAELRDAIATMAIVRWGGWARGDGGAYAEGFVSGLKTKIHDAQAALLTSDQQTHALTLQSNKLAIAIVDKAKDWLATEHKIKLGKRSGSSGSRSGSSAARREGRQDGANYNATRPTTRPKLG